MTANATRMRKRFGQKGAHWLATAPTAPSPARRKWTAKDDDILRRFVAERKWSDADIGDIMGRGEVTIRRHRKCLGLPCGKPWGGMRKGTRWNGESRERLSQRMRERYENPEERAKLREMQRNGNRVRWENYRKLPPKGTPERKFYRKLKAALGIEAARQELGL